METEAGDDEASSLEKLQAQQLRFSREKRPRVRFLALLLSSPKSNKKPGAVVQAPHRRRDQPADPLPSAPTCFFNLDLLGLLFVGKRRRRRLGCRGPSPP